MQEYRDTFIICNTSFPRQQWLRERPSVSRYTYVTCLVILVNRQKSRATASGKWLVRLCPFRPDLTGLSYFWSPFSGRGTNFSSSLLLRLKCFGLCQCVRPGMLPALLNVHHLFLVCVLKYFSHVFDSRIWQRATWTSVGTVHVKNQYL
jgi:hypothetical protein